MKVFRILEPAIGVVEKLLRERQRVGKQELDSEETEHAIDMFKNTVNNKRVVHWGALKNNELIAYMTQVFSSQTTGAWNMSFLATKPGMSWDYQSNGLDALWRIAFFTGEKFNCPDVVWSLPSAWGRSYIRTQRNSTVWPRYDIHTYSHVPAGEFPQSNYDKWVYGDRIKPYPVLLRRAVKKPVEFLR